MSELREAAQAALEQWDKVSGVFRMTAETEALRAALAQPETEDHPPRDEWREAVIGALEICMILNDANRDDPERAMSDLMGREPRDEWRPASAPPDSDRVVLLWSTEFAKTGSLEVGWYGKHDGSDEAPCWWASHGLQQDPRDILYWRDVTPPTESTIAAKCQRIERSGEICGLTPPCPDCGSSLIDVPEGSL